jgi:hypothetical protein
MQNNQTAMQANVNLLETKRKETEAINAKYDEDKRRFAELEKAGATTSAAPVAAAPASKR